MVDSNEFRARIESELKLVTQELRSLGVQNPDLGSDWIPVAADTEVSEADENVLADKYEDLATREGIVADLETRFNNLRRALTKIDDGAYGICEVCNEAIEPERLEANPAARTCKLHLEAESELAA